MTAAALLVVLGAALLMELGGLSTAMGAFLAGVLLSESTFRHQLEAEIEPFRGILLGLFFLGVGMSLDLSAVAREWQLILAAVLVFMAVKSIGVYAVARALRASHGEALTRAALLAQGGEFAFVLYGAAAAVGIFDAHLAAVLIAVVIISMALTPLCVLALRWLLPKPAPSMDGWTWRAIWTAARSSSVSGGSARSSPRPCWRAASRCPSWTPTRTPSGRRQMGRESLLRGRNSGGHAAHRRRRDRQADPGLHRRSQGRQPCGQADQVGIPLVKLVVRAYDRIHALALVKEGVDFQVRETLESALAFGEAALREAGVPADEAEEAMADVRRRDAERFELEVAGGLFAGRSRCTAT